MTPPRIRGLVQRFENCLRMEFHDKANRLARKRETAAARFEVLRAFAVVAYPPASPDVEGLVKALERISGMSQRNTLGSIPVADQMSGIAQSALSTWRQGQEEIP